MEFGSFTPLVFTTSGGMGPGAHLVYKRLASMIANHQKKSYSTMINAIRCRITFSLLRSACNDVPLRIKITQIHTSCTCSRTTLRLQQARPDYNMTTDILSVVIVCCLIQLFRLQKVKDIVHSKKKDSREILCTHFQSEKTFNGLHSSYSV